jgi:23S rRNA G2445 N2-methylase RlmL
MKAASKATEGKVMLPPVLRWKNTDRALWTQLCEEAQMRRQKGLQWLLGSNPDTGDQNCLILGNDVHKGAYRLALHCRQEADLPKLAVEFHNSDCQEWKISGRIVEGRTIVVVNPPWGLRLDIETEQSWGALKSFLREECVGAEAWILSGNKHLTRILNMKKTRSVPLKTAAETLRWLQYPIFKSSTINTRNNTEVSTFNV